MRLDDGPHCTTNRRESDNKIPAERLARGGKDLVKERRYDLKAIPIRRGVHV